MIKHRCHRRGAILIVTMFIVFALASLVLVMSSATRVEVAASSNIAAAMQASSVERGAEQYVMALLTEDLDNLGNEPDSTFAAVPVGDGYFWLCRTDFGDNQPSLFGLVDEGSKLNINTVDYDTLLKLPNMTPDAAASIVAWRTAGETAANGGAKSSYYGTLRDPYTCKNAPYETVEELLLVQGVSRELLYGNGTAPPLGMPVNTPAASGQVATDLQTARGWLDLLTVYSKAAGGATSTASGGKAGAAGGKVNINTPDHSALRAMLEDKLGQSRGDQIADQIGTRDRYIDVFDFYFQVGLKPDELDTIYDSLTVAADSSAAPVQRSLVNVNTAPRDVLLCLPGLESADVDKLMAQRQNNTPGDTSVAWVVQALDKKSVGLGNLINGKSSQYMADIVAVSGNGRAFKHVRFVVDVGNSPPKVLYRRDFTDRGWPMDPQILESLRAGRGVGGAAGAFGTNAGGAGAMSGGINR